MQFHPHAGPRLAGLAAALIVAATTTAGLASASTGPDPGKPGQVRAMLEAPAPAGPVQGEYLLAAVPPRITGKAKEKRRAERAERKRATRKAAQRRRNRARSVHPVKGEVSYGQATGRFGAQRSSHIHQGQDIFAGAGTPLRAVRDSKVLASGSGDARGNWVALHSRRDQRTYVYFHMLKPASVAAGERVEAGDRVGRVGCTGRCFGDHLHFEIHRGRNAAGAAIDPMPLLAYWAKQG